MADEKKDEEKAEAKGGGKGKLIIMILPTVLLLAGAAWFFLFRGKDSNALPKPLPAPVPGAVVALDSFSINLSGGHFLKLGMTLQPDKTASADLSGAKALDLAIQEYSGQTISYLATSDGRQATKDELVSRIKLSYLPETAAGEEALQEAILVAKGKSVADAVAESKAGKATDSTASHELSADEQIRQLTAKQAEAAADALTVQTQVYDVYYTEFVMQ